jgi:hypothetical protein
MTQAYTTAGCVGLFACRGGGIELAILSAHYGREIAAFDIRTKRCDRCACVRALEADCGSAVLWLSPCRA